MTKTTLLLKRLYSNFKYILCGTCIYFLLLIVYDLLVFARSKEEILVTYICGAVVCVLAWFAMKFVLWIQVKNPVCTEKVFNFFSMFFLTGFALAALILFFEFLLCNFVIGAFISPVVCLSVIHTQGKRKEFK
ncbi:MAG: hypothetical protein E7600_06265 [Ruminococcaceae bacterium]|nr:hypothetical protein [Oscillospiraceae bacterium]